jgi:hypothetical protein
MRRQGVGTDEQERAGAGEAERVGDGSGDVVGGEEEANEQAGRPRATRRKVGRPPKTLQRSGKREQRGFVRGHQAISAAAQHGGRSGQTGLPLGAHAHAQGGPEAPAEERAGRNVQRRQGSQEKAGCGEQSQQKRAERQQEHEGTRAERRMWQEESASDREWRTQAREARGDDREQHHAERTRWHEEIAWQRARRLARSCVRAARHARGCTTSERTASQIVGDQEPLSPLAQPPERIPTREKQGSPSATAKLVGWRAKKAEERKKSDPAGKSGQKASLGEASVSE